MSAYFLYIQENRDSVQKELGVKYFGPVTKCLAARWKTLSTTARGLLDKKATELKAGYEKDLAAFKAAGEQKRQKADKGRQKRQKRQKADKAANKEANADKPKAPVGGAYGVYLVMNRAEITKGLPAGSACTEVTKVAGARFKALGEKEKAIYEAGYQEKKAKYTEELAVWKAAKGADVEEDDEEDGKDAKVRKAGA